MSDYRRTTFLLATLLITACADAGPVITNVPGSITASRDSLILVTGDSATIWLDVRNTQHRPYLPPAVYWTSSAPTVAAISEAGTVTALTTGTGVVEARIGTVVDSVWFVAIPPITATYLNGPDTLRYVGATGEIRAHSVAGSEPREGEYVYVALDTSVLRITRDQRGHHFVHALRPGPAEVRVEESGGTYDSKVIYVVPQVVRLVVTGNSGHAGVSIPVEIQARDARGAALALDGVSLSVKDTSIAVPESGFRVRLKRDGRTTMSVSGPNHTYAEASLHVLRMLKLLIGFGNSDTIIVGTGQDARVPVSGNLDTALKLVSLDTNVVSVTPDSTDVVFNRSFFTLHARSSGAAMLIASNPIQEHDTALVVVVDTRLSLLPPYESSTIAAGDSIAFSLLRIGGTWFDNVFRDDLSVAVASSDTTVIMVHDADREPLLSTQPPSSTQSVRLRAIGPGTATVTAVAEGVPSATVSYTVTSERKVELTPDGVTTMGAGQTTAGAFPVTSKPWRVTLGPHAGAVQVSFSHSAPALVEMPESVLINANVTDVFADVATINVGVDTIVASAPGYLPDTTVLIVTTPHFVVGDSTPILERNAFTMPISVADSLGNAFHPTDSVTMTGWSSDTTGLEVLAIRRDTLRIIADMIWPGYRSAYIPLILRDTGSVTFVINSLDRRYASLSLPVQVTLNSTLAVTTIDGPVYAAVGMQQYGSRIEASSNMHPPITLTSSDTSVLYVDSVTTEWGDTELRVVGGSSTGTATITASADGHRSVTSDPVTVGVPQLRIIPRQDSIAENQAVSFWVALTDQMGTARATAVERRIRLETVDDGFAGDTIVAPGFMAANFQSVRFTRPGSFLLVAQDVTGGAFYIPDTINVNVWPAPSTVRVPVSAEIGLGQRLRLDLEWPNHRAGDTSSLSVISRSGRTIVPPTVQRKTDFITVVGDRIGTDFVVISGGGVVPDSTSIRVGEGRFALWVVDADSAKVGSTHELYLHAVSPAGMNQDVAEPMIVDVATTGGIRLQDAAGAVTETLTILPGHFSPLPTKLVAIARGNAEIVLSRPGYIPLRVQMVVR